jgi:hypothetical protein
MGDMIDAKITALAKLTPYAKVDTTLLEWQVNQDGSQVGLCRDAENVAEGDEITTKKLELPPRSSPLGRRCSPLG